MTHARHFEEPTEQFRAPVAPTHDAAVRPTSTPVERGRTPREQPPDAHTGHSARQHRRPYVRRPTVTLQDEPAVTAGRVRPSQRPPPTDRGDPKPTAQRAMAALGAA